MTQLTKVKVTKRSIAQHTCPVCKARLSMGKKLNHFKAMHPEYKISRHRIDADHSGYKCEVCGAVNSTFKGVINHFAATHPSPGVDVTPGQAWLDELPRRLEQRKVLLEENKRLQEQNKALQAKIKELLEKLVRFQRLMSQPD